MGLCIEAPSVGPRDEFRLWSLALLGLDADDALLMPLPSSSPPPLCLARFIHDDSGLSWRPSSMLLCQTPLLPSCAYGRG